jgi:hypothetical protein
MYYQNPVQEGSASVVRNVADYTGAFSRSVSVWDTTLLYMVQGGGLQLKYGSYGNNGWLGLATITTIGCRITSAKSQLNDSYLRSSSYSQTNIDHVACQEVGHTFGLGHNRSATDTCMNDSILTPGAQYNSHDVELLNTIYAGASCGGFVESSCASVCSSDRDACMNAGGGWDPSDWQRCEDQYNACLRSCPCT